MYENKPYFEPKESGNEAADLMAEFALCMKRGDSPDSPAAQSVAEQWRNCQCVGCGDTFSARNIPADAEFYGAGTSQYMTEAIEFYCKQGR